MKKILIIVLLGFLFVSFTSAFNWDDNRVVVYYNMENTSVFDLTGHGYSGTNTGADSISGLLGNAINFSGFNSDYVLMPNISTSLWTVNASLNVWIKMNDITGNQHMWAFSNKTAGATYQSGDVIQNQIAGGAFGVNTFRDDRVAITQEAGENGAWTMITITQSPGTNNYKVYVNGTLINQSIGENIVQGLLATGYNWQLGRFYQDGDGWLYGNYTIDEMGIWNRTLEASEITELYNGGVGLAFEVSGITISLVYPSDGLMTVVDSINFSANVSSSATNVTIEIWNTDNGTLFFNQTNISGISGIYNFSVTSLSEANYNWTVYAFDGTTPDAWLSETREFEIVNFIVNNISYNATTVETASEIFSVNITTDGNVPSSAKLIYNGTTYTGATITSLGSDIYIMSRTIDIPLNNGNKTFNFNFTLGGNELSTSVYGQNVSDTVFTLCNATYANDFLNLTFRDENTLAFVNATIQSSTWEYYLGSGLVTKTYSYSTSDNSSNYSFCGSPTEKNMFVNPSVTYLSDGYPVRIWETSTQTYTNITTNQSLYLLSSADGIYVTFIVATESNTPISGADISIVRTISGSNVTISEGQTDSAGSFTAWLNPNQEHYVTASKTGYGTTTQLIRPTQSTYTIILSSELSEFVYVDDYSGLKWFVFPGVGLVNVSNITSYGFNISAQNDNLVKCRIDLLNNNKSITLATAETIASNTSSCSVQVSYTINSSYPQVKGRLLVDLGDGYQILEDDAFWRMLDLNKTDSTITDWFNGLTGFDLSYFNNNEQHREYTYILLFFLVVTLICAVMNYAGWDIQSEGGTIFIVGILIWVASIPGFLTLSGATPFAAIDRFAVAGVYSAFMIGRLAKEFT